MCIRFTANSSLLNAALVRSGRAMVFLPFLFPKCTTGSNKTILLHQVSRELQKQSCCAGACVNSAECPHGCTRAERGRGTPWSYYRPCLKQGLWPAANYRSMQLSLLMTPWSVILASWPVRSIDSISPCPRNPTPF